MAFENAKKHLEQFGLSDRVREFSQSSATVELAAQALAAFLAGGQAGGRAVIAGGHHALVLYNHSADGPAGGIAAGPGGYQMRHIHKANIPLVQAIASKRSV